MVCCAVAMMVICANRRSRQLPMNWSLHSIPATYIIFLYSTSMSRYIFHLLCCYFMMLHWLLVHAVGVLLIYVSRRSWHTALHWYWFTIFHSLIDVQLVSRHSQCSIVHRPLVSIEFGFVLPPPSYFISAWIYHLHVFYSVFLGCHLSLWSFNYNLIDLMHA